MTLVMLQTYWLDYYTRCQRNETFDFVFYVFYGISVCGHVTYCMFPEAEDRLEDCYLNYGVV